MKIAVSTYSLARWRREEDRSLEDTIDLVAELGAEGVEFAGLDEKAEADPVGRAADLKARCQERGLASPSYCVWAELLVPADAQAETVERLKRHVDTAVALGASTMRHDITRGYGDDFADRFPDWSGEQSFEAAVAHVVPAIREVADFAQAKGVTTSLENHGFYMQAPDRVGALIEAVDHENFGLTIDLGNFLCVNADPVAAARQLAGHVIMAHAKDFHVKADKTKAPTHGWIHTPTEIAIRGAILGHGEVDTAEQIKILQAAGYDGWVSLEFEGLEPPAEAVRLGLEKLKADIAAAE